MCYTVQTTEYVTWKRHTDQSLLSKATATEPQMGSGPELLLVDTLTQQSSPSGSQSGSHKSDSVAHTVHDKIVTQATHMPTSVSMPQSKDIVIESLVDHRYPTSDRRAPRRLDL